MRNEFKRSKNLSIFVTFHSFCLEREKKYSFIAYYTHIRYRRNYTSRKFQALQVAARFKLRDLNHSPSSSSFIPFSHYLLSNRKIKHVNPPRPLPFVFSVGRAQLVWQATTIKRALREWKEAGIVDASVQMLILIPEREKERT